jgi:hypothetical protein
VSGAGGDPERPAEVIERIADALQARTSGGASRIKAPTIVCEAHGERPVAVEQRDREPFTRPLLNAGGHVLTPETVVRPGHLQRVAQRVAEPCATPSPTETTRRLAPQAASRTRR